jgi:hypothetical protein
MEFTVQKTGIVVDGKAGYAFIDKEDHCIIMIYGETAMKNWTKYFENDQTHSTVRKPELEEAYATL